LSSSPASHSAPLTLSVEYGVAYLHGKSLQQRAEALISIAHPMHRESLHKEFFERFRILAKS
jgi:acyl-CoA hydrolase